MNTLYWINVLGSFNSMLIMIISLSVFALIILFIHSLYEISSYDKVSTQIKNYIKITFSTLLASLLLFIFIPSKEQSYVIYGVGTVIDYAKNSKEVQKLPDNAVKALNKYLEEVNNDSIK